MRLKGAVLVPALMLAGCAGSSLDGLNRMSASEAQEPYPANYRALLQHHYGRTRPTDLAVTEPRTLPAANAFDPIRWYVCIKTAAGVETVHVISRNRLEGTIKVPAAPKDGAPEPSLCDGGTYGPLG
jgi:hypothetical protein